MPWHQICLIVNFANTGLNNGLLPVPSQAIIWTNASLLFNGSFWTYLGQIKP